MQNNDKIVEQRVDIHGKVSYVNQNLLYFMLDDTIINAGIYLARNSCITIDLPKVGDYLYLTNLHGHQETINHQKVASLCPNNEQLLLQVSVCPILNYYKWIIEDYDFGIIDLFIITKMYEKIRNSVISSEEDISDLILSYVQNELLDYPKKCQMKCSNNVVPYVKCKTVSQLSQIELNGKHYTNFPVWSFGTHWPKGKQILIGYLFVHPQLGTICLKDKNYTIGCVIVNSDKGIDELLNKTVYVERYCIMTEIFNPNSSFNLEYLYMNFEDIRTAQNKRKRESTNSRERFKFAVLAKSNVTMHGDGRRYHYWLRVKQIGRNPLIQEEECFLCFPDKFIEFWPQIHISLIYSLDIDKDLRKISSVEYDRIEPKLGKYLISDHATIAPLFNKIQLENLPFLNVDTLPKLLESENILVSFDAKLKCRKFCNKNDSRTGLGQSKIVAGFGTLAGKTHMLDFHVDDDVSLTLYLNNWERMVMPIGLIPDVVVRIRNVYVQQKKYCKSCALTTLEILDYRPKMRFSTAKLLNSNDWGPISTLLDADSLPSGALIHIVIRYFYVSTLWIRRQCRNCNVISKKYGDFCIKCESELEYKCSMTFEAKDENGSMRITSHRLETIATFLGLEGERWTNWKESFDAVGSCEFRRGEITDCVNSKRLRFQNSMIEFIRENEENAAFRARMLCRKLDNDRHANKEESLWYGIKAELIS